MAPEVAEKVAQVDFDRVGRMNFAEKPEETSRIYE